MENTCPCCDRHCPVNDLHCGKGRKYFGISEERPHREHTNNNDPKAIALIRRCGRYLHHGIDRDADTSHLLKALSSEEIALLEDLLEKCLADWERK